MLRATQVLQLVATALFVGLACVTGRQWFKHREPIWKYLALGLTALAAVSVIGEASKRTGYRYALLSDLSLISFLASGYLLVLVRDQFLPIRRSVKLIALGTLAGAGVFATAARLPRVPGSEIAGVDLAAIWAVVATWSFWVIEPVVRFWIAGGRRPAVQRARLRALAAGYGSIVGVLVFAMSAGVSGPKPGLRLSYQIVSLALLGMLYAAVLPPRWLRRFWRQSEEDAYRQGMQDLLLFTPEPSVLADRGLEWAMRLVGAEGGVVLDADRRVLATRGVPAGEPGGAPRGRSTIVVPLHLSRGAGSIVVVAGPITPLFGSDEVARLREYSSSLAMALDRVGLVGALEGERERYESLLQAVSDLGEGFLVVEDLRVAYANDAYCRISGYSLQELMALESIIDLASPDEKASIEDRVRRRKAGESLPNHYESAMIHKSGRRVDVEVAVKSALDGPVLRTITIVRDISDRKQAERELLRMDAGRRTFTANAAHELRTPLAVITGMATMLSEHRSTMPADTVDQGFSALSRQVERMGLLVDNLLDLTQLDEDGQPTALEPVAVSLAARRALEAAPPPDGITVDVSGVNGAAVLADPVRLDQVLVNIFTNAYRYGGARVRVETAASDGSCLLTIADDGPGVPDDLVPHLFDPFTRGATSRQTHGSGLGLAIVRRLVEAFGGEVWYEPGTPSGARFHILLKQAAA